MLLKKFTYKPEVDEITICNIRDTVAVGGILVSYEEGDNRSLTCQFNSEIEVYGFLVYLEEITRDEPFASIEDVTPINSEADSKETL